MSDYKFTVELGAGLTQMGDNTFPLMRAKDVEYQDGRLTDFMPVYVSEEEYKQLEADGLVKENVPYFVYIKLPDQLENNGSAGGDDTE